MDFSSSPSFLQKKKLNKKIIHILSLNKKLNIKLFFYPLKIKIKILKRPHLSGDIAIPTGDSPTMLKNIFTTLLTINAIEGPLPLS